MSEKIAHLLFQEGAAIINVNNPVKLASGVSSPIYVDVRKLISLPSARETVTAAFKEILLNENEIGRENFDAVAGVKNAGIPWASLIAWELNLPLLEEEMVGASSPDQHVVYFEDSVTTGSSLLKEIKVARKNRAKITDCLAIYSYDSSVAHEGFAKNNLRFKSLTNLKALLSVAETEKFASPEEIVIVRDWAVTTLGCNF